MFYKYTVSYRSGTKLSGYACAKDTTPKDKVRDGITRRLMGDYRLRVETYGTEFPPINSDYILDLWDL